MVKRRDVIRFLEQNGFFRDGGTNHDKYIDGKGHITFVPRHREIDNYTFNDIKRQMRLNRSSTNKDQGGR